MVMCHNYGQTILLGQFWNFFDNMMYRLGHQVWLEGCKTVVWFMQTLVWSKDTNTNFSNLYS